MKRVHDEENRCAVASARYCAEFFQVAPAACRDGVGEHGYTVGEERA
jgi:hypothetical protein